MHASTHGESLKTNGNSNLEAATYAVRIIVQTTCVHSHISSDQVEMCLIDVTDPSVGTSQEGFPTMDFLDFQYLFILDIDSSSLRISMIFLLPPRLSRFVQEFSHVFKLVKIDPRLSRFAFAFMDISMVSIIEKTWQIITMKREERGNCTPGEPRDPFSLFPELHSFLFSFNLVSNHFVPYGKF